MSPGELVLERQAGSSLQDRGVVAACRNQSLSEAIFVWVSLCAPQSMVAEGWLVDCMLSTTSYRDCLRQEHE
jgi:hypothetical protein